MRSGEIVRNFDAVLAVESLAELALVKRIGWNLLFVFGLLAWRREFCEYIQWP